MKKIIVVGYNDFSKEVLSVLNNVKVILDDLTKDESFNNINIDRISNINKYIDDSDVYVIDDMPYFDELYHKLYYQGINKIYVIVKEEIDNINDALNNSHIYYLKDKPVLRYVETHISDKCNLRCNGCTHFSNITEFDSITLDNFKKNMDLLSEKFDVTMIRLMGGEPLLKQDLDEYVSYARSKFKDATIFVVTNGLLVRTLNEKILDSFKKNNIIINMTLYKPIIKSAKEIDEFLTKNGIKHRFGRGNKQIVEEDYILKFHTCLDTIKINRNEKLNCYNQYCWFLRNERLYKCPYSALIDVFNKKYNLNFKVENDYVDIKNITDGWKTIKELSEKIDFCDYCRNRVKEYEWNNGSPKLEHYILGGKDGDIED